MSIHIPLPCALCGLCGCPDYRGGLVKLRQCGWTVDLTGWGGVIARAHRRQRRALELEELNKDSEDNLMPLVGKQAKQSEAVKEMKDVSGPEPQLAPRSCSCSCSCSCSLGPLR